MASACISTITVTSFYKVCTEVTTMSEIWQEFLTSQFPALPKL